MLRLDSANRDRETYAGKVEGSFLTLYQPLEGVEKLYVAGVARFDGMEVDLAGHLTGTVLTGASNVAMNEPVFVNGRFINFAGQTLQTLSLGAPLPGAPETLLVLEPVQGLVFVAGFGGHLPPTISPFHGFRTVLPMREADAADRRRFAKRSLTVLEEHTDELVTEAWHYDPRDGRIYASITIDGVTDVVEVIDLPVDVRLAA